MTNAFGRCGLGYVWVVVFLLPTIACGGSSGSPTAPSPPVMAVAQVSVQVSPSPVPATRVSTGQTSATFRIAMTLTFRETAGTAAQITQLTGTFTQQPGAQTSGGTATVSLSLPANGSYSESFTQEFEVTSEVETVSWRVSASGTDASGRAFTAASNVVSIEPPEVAPPPPPTAARYELWGGPAYSVFLGCWSCSRFDRESVFNEFGPYGSRFSATSVTNRFSRYGSAFSSDSACNKFASNPPIIFDTARRTYSELTLNAFRPYANTDPSVVSVLRNYICSS